MRTTAAIVAAYLVAGAVMLAPITSYRHLDSATFGGDTRLNVWALAWVDHAMLDRAPLFDANIFFPAANALAYSEHLIGIAVFALPVYALTRNAALSYNVVWLLSYLFAALAAYALARRVTRDRLAAFVGGLAYAFCFYRMLHGHAHLQLLWACWIPLGLLLLERWWREPRGRTLAWLWVVTLLQVLTSWYLAVMVLVTDALFAIWLVVVRRPSRDAWSRMAAQLAVAAALGAAAVWPIARHYTFLIARQNPAEALGGAAALRDFFVPPANTWMGQWLLHHGSQAPPWIWGEKTLYLGFVALGLGAVGAGHAVAGPRAGDCDGTRWLGFFALLASVALALSFGPSAHALATGSFDWTPFGLFSALPGMSLFRVPARFAQLITLAVAIFAAEGAAVLHRRFGRAGAALVVLLLPLMLSEWFLVDFPGGAPQPERIPAVYRQLAKLPVRAVVTLPDYIGGPEWFTEADYQYYSTASWRPIVNGYSRIEPPGYSDRMAVIATFPSAESAALLRSLGVDYLVLQAARYRQGAAEKVSAAMASRDFTLAAQFGSDYLFRVN